MTQPADHVINVQRIVGWCVVMLPWLAALYLHFWLVENEAWAPEQSYRGLMSVLLLALGMLNSFLLHGRLKARREL